VGGQSQHSKGRSLYIHLVGEHIILSCTVSILLSMKAQLPLWAAKASTAKAGASAYTW
jgi:hypothetical protein